jgi:hypothetical protein
MAIWSIESERSSAHQQLAQLVVGEPVNAAAGYYEAA